MTAPPSSGGGRLVSAGALVEVRLGEALGERPLVPPLRHGGLFRRVGGDRAAVGGGGLLGAVVPPSPPKQ